MKRRRLVVFPVVMLCLFILTAENALAKKVKGVEFPETVTIEGSSCTLTGVGIRKKLIINVYLGALYQAKPAQSPGGVISSEQVKRVVMHFLYKEVTAEQLIEAWNEGFANNAGAAVSALKDKIDHFNALFNEPLRKGEKMEMTYVPGKGTEVVIKGRSRGVIEGSDFMNALFSIWFGPKPPSKGLKNGMLNQ